MLQDTYVPLFSEILNTVSKLKTKKEKVAHLQRYNSEALRMLIKSSFDPKIEWLLPEGTVPFMANDAPEGTEHTMLLQEARKLYHFILTILYQNGQNGFWTILTIFGMHLKIVK